MNIINASPVIRPASPITRADHGAERLTGRKRLSTKPALAIGRPILPGQASAPMKTRVYVTLKNGVLDPQGKAIHHALEGLGFEGVNDVRAGKLIELDLDPGVSEAEVEAMCRKLLANTVIENFRIEAESRTEAEA
jgi:phosphoribosylformylglycinamidine synthase